MKKAMALVLLTAVTTVCPALAQDDFDKAFDKTDKAFDRAATVQEESWDKLDTALEAQWEAQVKQANAEWEKLRAEVERKWDEFYYSTNKEWVDYDEGKDTRSRVDFEAGEIEVTALVPVAAPDGTKVPTPYGAKVPTPQVLAQAKAKIEQQVEKIFSDKNEVKAEVLADQVTNSGGQPVTPQNVAQYVEHEVVPQVTVEEKPVVSKDGQPRLKVTARIRMVPKHLEIRAGKFKPQVKTYADKYQLDPALVLAVIHTESYFNPLAKSRIPAYGLMQIVPRYAGLEAYHYLYQEKKLLPADYLYNPENNILLGATYLYLLHERYFSRIKNPDNRWSLCIAAYNCGPTRLNKNLAGKRDVNNMAGDELVEAIRQAVPAETKDYILKVRERIPLYEGMI